MLTITAQLGRALTAADILAEWHKTAADDLAAPHLNRAAAALHAGDRARAAEELELAASSRSGHAGERLCRWAIALAGWEHELRDAHGKWARKPGEVFKDAGWGVAREYHPGDKVTVRLSGKAVHGTVAGPYPDKETGIPHYKVRVPSDNPLYQSAGGRPVAVDVNRMRPARGNVPGDKRMVSVWRVEDARHQGPVEGDIAESLHGQLPNLSPGYLSAVTSPEALDRYFGKATMRKLAGRGYKVARYDVPQRLVHRPPRAGKHEVAFLPPWEGDYGS